MKNIHEVIRAKEQQMQQLQKEIEALKTAARILEESEPAPARAASPANVQPPPMVMRPAPAAPAAQKENASYVAASAWDVAKPQFP